MKKDNGKDAIFNIIFICAIGAILLIFLVPLIGVYQEYYSGKSIHIKKVLTISDFENLSLEKFPSLKKGDNLEDMLRFNVTAEELVEFENIDSEYVKIGRAYYKILPSYRSVKVSKVSCGASENGVAIANTSIPALRDLLVKAAKLNESHNPDLTSEELLRIDRFVKSHGSVVSFGNECYRIVLDSRIYLKPECVEVEGIENYPLLKRGLMMAESGEAMFTAPPGEWSEIMSFLHGRDFIAYNGSCYWIGFLTT